MHMGEDAIGRIHSNMHGNEVHSVTSLPITTLRVCLILFDAALIARSNNQQTTAAQRAAQVPADFSRRSPLLRTLRHRQRYGAKNAKHC